MADFKTVLEALAKGDMDIEAFAKQLTQLLEKSPQYAKRMLSQLDDMHDQKKINDQIYARLKGQINQYRRAHATETETKTADESDFDNDATEFAQEDNAAASGSADDQATQVVTGESTQVISNNDNQDTAAFDVTGGSDLSAVDIDISAVGGGDTNAPSVTSATGPTGTEWTDPSAGGQMADANLGPGSIIKQRFKLLEVLGVGGMGKVYKGLDLLKEEARDKNPYVAIKLLNEDFKGHPEAFISLQRESSRQQKLAHPNIATVYDFDRVGGPGTPVYITMELMEGMELKDFIKKKARKQGGLPFDEAFGIIKQLCAALSYAHERRLVHSDFKPGNAFLCNDGTVKTLDFGIARAVKNPVTGEAEKTLFDPGKLGALTPAYASLEMLEGAEPDTRDDTYALGCVAYELLTGKHPFNKLPANKAKENNLVPANVKGLKKKQNRALKRAVAYLRKDRPATVDQFLEEFEARYIWYKHPLTLAAIFLVLAALGLTVPTLNYLHKQEINQIIADINTGDSQIIVDRLASISEFEKADKLTIADEAKGAIQEYYEKEISKLIDTSNQDYSFPAAENLLQEVSTLYPASSFLGKQTELWSDGKKQQLSALYSEFSDALKDESLLAKTKNILETIRLKIDPENPLLTDPRPSNQYRILADEAFEIGNYDDALALVESGLNIAPNNEPLLDSKTKISQKIEVIGLENKLSSIQGQLVSLSDYGNNKEDIIRLASLEQDNALLVPLASGLRDNIDQEISSLLSTGTRADADAMASEYGDLLSALKLGRELTQIKLAHLAGEERTNAIQSIVTTDKKNIDDLIKKPVLTDAKWKSQMLANIQELDSLSDEDSTIQQDLAGIRESVAKLYIAKANETLEAKRFDVANSLINSGEQFAPTLEDIQLTRTAIADAKAAQEKKIRVDGLKEDFKIQTEANQVVKAMEYLDQLKTELPQSDPYIATEAPGMLSGSYERLANSRFAANDYANALKLADEGLKFNPKNANLQRARTEYAVEANIVDLNKEFKSAITFDIAAVQSKIGVIANSPRSSKFRQDAINLFVERINTMRTSDETSAAALAQNAAAIFPGAPRLEKLKNELQLKPWPEAALANSALSAGNLTQVETYITRAEAEYSDHPEVLSVKEAVEQKKTEANNTYNSYLSAKENALQGASKKEIADSLKKSEELLIVAANQWKDNNEYIDARRELKDLIKQYSQKIRAREEAEIETVATAPPSTTTGTTTKAAAPVEWKPVISEAQCTERLAGYGKRSKAVCFDMISAKSRGPYMVVIPAGEGFQHPFAIGKFEISVKDWGKYCALSGRCTPITDQARFDQPMTGITLKQAEEYAQWVSERTGKKYRIPTVAEWEYAAMAGGKQPKKDYNCRVALGEKVIKGTGVVSIKSGQSNGWGMKNYVGNVQEWVLDGNSIKARGGAYQDAHSKCDISLERAHNGGADDATGFRLILEDVG